MASQKPNNGGYVYREGTSPNTRLLNTQKVKLFSIDADTGTTPAQIGLLQSWNPTQNRSVEPHRGMGFGDQIAELGVGLTELQASCSIMMMYLKDIMQVFGYKAGSSGLMRSLKHHRWPFDVKESIVIPTFLNYQAGAAQSEDGARVILTTYEGCWMTDYSKSFNMGDTAATQDTSLMITNVFALGEFDGESDDAINEVNRSKMFALSN
jgi:hypothetical protein